MDSQHLTGNHTYNGGVTRSCVYNSNGNKYCETTAAAIPYGVINDTGILQSLFVGYHVAHMNTAVGGGGNPDGGSQATGTGAGAVELCATTSCIFTVNVNPVSFPPGSVWTHSQTYTQTCPAELDPDYNSGGGGSGYGGNCGNGGCGGQSGGGCGSPIIVDAYGEGFHMTDVADGVLFDIRGDGHPIDMGWTARGYHNAFLALDRNGNGKIDNGEELFGNYTPQPKSKDANGYAALAEFDKPENGGNGDGVIDEKDAIYSKLLLWIDKNHDGISQPNELHHLWELGVFSLSLKYVDTPHRDAFGNWFRYKGKVNPLGEPGSDPVDRISYDVFFELGTSGPKPDSCQ